MKNQTSLYPWQQSQWQQLQNAKQQQRLPHALLLTGIPGLGKRDFALHFAASLLCVSPQMDGDACGDCKNCHLLQANNHPDFFLIEPEEIGKSIKIDQIRSLSTALTQTSHQQRYKIAIVAPADAMNNATANALLKTLEEPSAKTILLLVSSEPALLPATIRSRCQSIIFSPAKLNESLAWLTQQGVTADDVESLLQLSPGAPLAALAWTEDGRLIKRGEFLSQFNEMLSGRLDPLQLAASWYKDELAFAIDCISNWLSAAIRASMGLPDSQNLPKCKLDMLKSFTVLDELLAAKNRLKRNINLNQQLVLETLLLSVQKVTA